MLHATPAEGSKELDWDGQSLATPRFAKVHRVGRRVGAVHSDRVAIVVDDSVAGPQKSIRGEAGFRHSQGARLLERAVGDACITPLCPGQA